MIVWIYLGKREISCGGSCSSFRVSEVMGFYLSKVII